MHSTDLTANVGNEVHLQRDVELVSAVLAGSEWAFADMHRLYAHSLYRTIFTITKNHEDAEDVLQETMLRAYLALDSFEGRSKLISWLTRIAINSALMTLRKRRVRREAHFDALSDVGEELPALEFRDSRPTPEEACLQLERGRSVLRAVSKLEPPLRADTAAHEQRGLDERARTIARCHRGGGEGEAPPCSSSACATHT